MTKHKYKPLTDGGRQHNGSPYGMTFFLALCLIIAAVAGVAYMDGQTIREQQEVLDGR